MKNKSLLLGILLIAMQSMVFSQTINNDYSLAKVGEKINGVLIFINAEPYYEYNYIATIKVSINWSGTKTENFEKTIKKAKKKYSSFNGMIFHSENLNKADLIRFKGLKLSKGGFSIGDNVSFVYAHKIMHGTVAGLKDKNAIIEVEDTNRIFNISYKKLTLTSEK